MAAWVVARRVTSGRWHRWIGDWDEAMSRRITPPQAGAPSGSSATTTTGTRALLACGVVAGPLVVAVAVLQALTRQGFDPSRHPLSLLRLGALGWIQITNFVVAGLLVVAFAVGLRRVLHPGRGARAAQLARHPPRPRPPVGVAVADPGLFGAGPSRCRPRAAGWAAYCVAAGVILLGIMAWPDPDTVLVQLAVAIVLGWAWLSALAARLLTRR
jgi:Protein of unknown function (DUF998)